MTLNPTDQRILVGVTGASGSVYAERLISFLSQRVPRVYVLFTETGKQVVRHELRPHDDGFSLARAAAGELHDAEKSVIRLLRNDDLFAPVASGSSAPTAMVVVPCSMGTLARINQGISGNLLERSADVCLKQKRPLIICPRETPLSTIHLRNMLSLSEMGAHIVPAMPAFYQGPETMGDMVDFVVGRLVEALGFDHDLYKAWNPRMR
jgi:4-hydroxy-3-polyprenylbenzoate decarboxylase